MTEKATHSTVQLAGIVLKVRDELTFSVREYRGEAVYAIEDGLKSRFYRIGLSEYTFLSLLDGRRTFADALGQTASVMRDAALSEADAASLCRWLVESGLATTPESRTSVRLFEASEQVRRAKFRRGINPIFVKLPLFNPDPLMKAGASAMGWVFSWFAILVWLVVVGTGLLCVGMQWDEATAMTSTIVSRDNSIWLAVITILLKLLHEFFHGIACRRFGGSVREAGLMTILLIPLPYVDVTSSWRLESRWQRLMISAAGMYVELFCAGVASCVWLNTAPGLMHQHAFNVMLSAGVVTVLFNANPLMRFDGYYMLTDLIEQPNLATHGQTLLKSLGRRWCLGLPASAAEWPEGRTWLVFSYGVAAFLWRIVISVGLIIGADAMFYGSGIILAAVAIVLWVILPVWKLLKFVICGNKTEQPNRLRVSIIGVGLVVMISIVAQLPWSERMEAPAVVDFDPLVEVRAAVAGFVDGIAVQNGDMVQSGSLLIQLRNPELNLKRSQLSNERNQSRQRSRVFHQKGDIAAWQAELQNTSSLTERLQQLDERLANLQIRSPSAGQIINSSLRSMAGTYVTPGRLIATIGSANTKTILSVVAEEHLNAFQQRTNGNVDVYIHGADGQRRVGKLRTPEPRATTQIPHPAFAATAGGPLDVRVEKSAAGKGGDDSSRVVFAKPQFLTRVELPRAVGECFHAGQIGFISFRASRGTVAEVTSGFLAAWWSRRQTALQQTWTRQ